MCDRQNSSLDSPNCGCFTYGTRNAGAAYTIDQTLTFQDPSTNKTYRTPHFRSHRNSLIFLCQKIPNNITQEAFSSFTNIAKLRKSTKTITNLINNKNGWYIVGWYKRGTVTDQNNDFHTISDKINLHISYLMPSDELTDTEKSNQFDPKIMT